MDEAKKTLLRALSVCGDAIRVAQDIEQDNTLGEATRKEIRNAATDFMLFVHAAIQEKEQYTE